MCEVYECPACGKKDVVKLYRCRHCATKVCFACVFRKRCCGQVPPEHQGKAQAPPPRFRRRARKAKPPVARKAKGKGCDCDQNGDTQVV